jgi:hypothetical protein
MASRTRKEPIDVPAWMFAVWLGMAGVGAAIAMGLFALGVPSVVARIAAAVPILCVMPWSISYKTRHPDRYPPKDPPPS